MRIQRVADGVLIVRQISFSAEQRVNFRFAQLDRQAAQPVSPPLSMRVHARRG